MKNPTRLQIENILRALLILSPAAVAYRLNGLTINGYYLNNSELILILSILAAGTYLYQSVKINTILQKAEEKFGRLKVIDGELVGEDEEGNRTTLT